MVSFNVYIFVHAELRLDYLAPGMRTFVSNAEKKLIATRLQSKPNHVEVNERVSERKREIKRARKINGMEHTGKKSAKLKSKNIAQANSKRTHKAKETALRSKAKINEKKMPNEGTHAYINR